MAVIEKGKLSDSVQTGGISVNSSLGSDWIVVPNLEILGGLQNKIDKRKYNGGIRFYKDKE